MQCGLVDNRLAVESVQQVPRYWATSRSMGHLGTSRSAGLIFRYCVTSGEPATDLRDMVTTRDMGERRTDTSHE